MTQWILNLIYASGYVGIVFLMFLENVFPPIPSEYIMPLAGFLVAEDKLSLVGVTIAGTLGSVLGALPLYYFGHRVGEEGFKKFADRYGKWLTLTREDIERANHWFDKYGATAVFVCRLVPGIRSFISIPAGVNKMNFAPFLFYTTLGSAIWTAFLASAGYYLHANFHQIDGYMDYISYAVFGSIILLYLRRVLKKN